MITEENALKEQLIFEVLENIFDSLAKTMGTNCEITLHDLRKSLDHSIIKIQNGHITGRTIGGPQGKPGINYLLSRNWQDLKLEQMHITNTGKTVKGSVCPIYFQETKPPIAMLSIIFDLTDVYKLNTSINSIFGITEHSLQAERTSLFLNDADEKIAHLADDIIAKAGKPVSEMSREDKIAIVKRLKMLGFFKVKGAMKIISNKLGSSKFTIYRYLNSDISAKRHT
jgi:predicted transcriptional regulator YheO